MTQTRPWILRSAVFLSALGILACTFTQWLGRQETVRGSGNVVEEAREVSGISGVHLATIGDLTITLGDTESLRVEAEDNLMEYIETDVFSGKLRIKIQENVRLNTTRPIRYYLTVTGLDSIEISSTGDIQAPDLEAERFSIRISSTGELEMGDLVANTVSIRISSSGDVVMGVLNADNLEIDISSTGNLDIAGGEVETQDISISSTGNYRAQDLASDEADVRLSSSGSATIWVRDRLTARLNSSGNLHYRGSPTVNSSTNSSGDVIQISE